MFYTFCQVTFVQAKFILVLGPEHFSPDSNLFESKILPDPKCFELVFSTQHFLDSTFFGHIPYLYPKMFCSQNLLVHKLIFDTKFLDLKGTVSGFLAANIGQQNLKESPSRCFLWLSFRIFHPSKTQYVWMMLVIYFRNGSAIIREQGLHFQVISAKCDYW